MSAPRDDLIRQIRDPRPPGDGADTRTHEAIGAGWTEKAGEFWRQDGRVYPKS